MDGYKIKEDKKGEWVKAAGNNCTDPYSFAVVAATCAVFEKLDQGAEIKEAHDAMYGHGLSGYMAGAVAQWVSHFHERGEEFNNFWNGQFNVSPEEAKGGTVNPAIVTIGK